MTKPTIPVVTIFDVGSRKCSMAIDESNGKSRLRIWWKPSQAGEGDGARIMRVREKQDYIRYSLLLS